MFKQRKLHQIVKKLMEENGRTVPLLKNCVHRHSGKTTAWLEFYGVGEDYSSYKATAFMGDGHINIYIEEKSGGKVVREDKYFGIQEDGSYEEHRPSMFA